MDAPLLLCFDGSDDSMHAMRHAAALMPGSDAVVVHVSKSTVDWGIGRRLGPLLAMPDVDAAIVERAQAVLDRGVTLAQELGFDASGELRTTGGAVWKCVLDVAQETQPALLVAGSHGHRMRDHLPLGSVAHGLTANSRWPVLVTHAGEHGDRDPRARSNGEALRIVVGHDGSPESDAALAAVARWFPDADTQVVTSWQNPATAVVGVAGPPLLVTPPADLDERLRDAAMEVANEGAEYARSLGLDASAAIVAPSRGIGSALLDHAEAQAADLVAVGTHGRGVVARAVLGTTAHFVVQHAHVPVLVVPGMPGDA